MNSFLTLSKPGAKVGLFSDILKVFRADFSKSYQPVRYKKVFVLFGTKTFTQCTENQRNANHRPKASFTRGTLSRSSQPKNWTILRFPWTVTAFV